MLRSIFVIVSTALILVSCTQMMSNTSHNKPLSGINITIDPGHGHTAAYDNFRIGPGGEREEWINLRVAKALASRLRRAGAKVILTRQSDVDVNLGARAALAIQYNSDLFVSIHHNGSENDTTMDLPIVYFFGPADENPASVDLGKLLLDGMIGNMTFRQPASGGVRSDHLIYSSGTSILRNTVDHMPGVIGEGGFFTNAGGEQRLSSTAYNKLEADVYFKAILAYVDRGLPNIKLIHGDSLKYIEAGQVLEFQLQDGKGGHDFEANAFRVRQDDFDLRFDWDPDTGLLSVQTEPSNDKTITLRVFARNTRGNALHPLPFILKTARGEAFYVYDKWYEAFDAADSLYTGLLDAGQAGVDPALIDQALDRYRLSLELQPVHPRSLETEQAILALLKLKQKTTGSDLGAEIQQQADRIQNYYP